MNRQQKYILHFILCIMITSISSFTQAMEQQNETTAEAVCFICEQNLPEVKGKNPHVVMLECGHPYHRTCLAPFLGRRQPSCSCSKTFTNLDKRKIQVSTVSPDSLIESCIATIIADNTLLKRALISLPPDIFEKILKTFPETLETSLAQTLTAAANAPTIDLARGCMLLLGRPGFQCPSLSKRVAEHVRTNGFLAEPVLQFLMERFNVSTITKKSFHELLPQGLAAHKQVQIIVAGFAAKHREEIQRGKSYSQWNCFMINPSVDKIPANIVFVADPMEVTYEEHRALVGSRKESTVYATFGCRDDRGTKLTKAARSSDKTLLALQTPSDFVIEIHKTIPANTPLVSTKIVLSCTCDYKTCNLMELTEIAFSLDNAWLRTIDSHDRVGYFKLPSAYINEQFTLDQIVFITIMQQLTKRFERKVYMTLSIAHKLLASAVLDSFQSAEKSMLEGELKGTLRHLREKRGWIICEVCPFSRHQPANQFWIIFIRVSSPIFRMISSPLGVFAYKKRCAAI